MNSRRRPEERTGHADPAPAPRRLRVIYLSYDGLAEPLGASQVFPYLRELSRWHRITLITCEKPEDLADRPAMEALRRACAERGIRWLPQRYHRSPRTIATLWDLMILALTTVWEILFRGADLVHARAYPPTFVALAVRALTGTPFLFDMRCFWAEEMIVAGRLRAGSRLHRGIKAAERACLHRAFAIVSLTEAGVRHLKAVDGPGLATARFSVIPTCVDVDLFRPAATGPVRPFTLGSVGTILSGWFRLGWLTGFLRATAAADPTARFTLITRESEAEIVTRMGDVGELGARLSIFSRPPAQMPEALQHLSAVAMFFEPGIAKTASCPTRMGEVLACGLPVVTGEGIGDVAEMVRGRRVGVIIEDPSEASMAAAVAELQALMADPDLSARCRRAAEELFSLTRGVEAYQAIYQQVPPRGRRA